MCYTCQMHAVHQEEKGHLEKVKETCSLSNCSTSEIPHCWAGCVISCQLHPDGGRWKAILLAKWNLPLSSESFNSELKQWSIVVFFVILPSVIIIWRLVCTYFFLCLLLVSLALSPENSHFPTLSGRGCCWTLLIVFIASCVLVFRSEMQILDKCYEWEHPKNLYVSYFI